MVLEFFQVLLALPEDLGVHALCRSYSGSIGFIEEESPLESSNVLPMSPIGLRSFPTGPGPAKSCEKKAAWERRLSSRRFRFGGEEGDKNVPPPGAPCSQKSPTAGPPA